MDILPTAAYQYVSLAPQIVPARSTALVSSLRISPPFYRGGAQIWGRRLSHESPERTNWQTAADTEFVRREALVGLHLVDSVGGGAPKLIRQRLRMHDCEGTVGSCQARVQKPVPPQVCRE